MWLTSQTQIILSDLESPFPFTISENVMNYSATSCVLNIWNIWSNPKERTQTNQLVRLIGLRMWTTCNPFCTVHLQFLFWWNSVGPVRHHTGRCLEKLGERNAVLTGTHDPTYWLCSLEPQDVFKCKFIACAVRGSTYALFIPLQLS